MNDAHNMREGVHSIFRQSSHLFPGTMTCSWWQIYRRKYPTRTSKSLGVNTATRARRWVTKMQLQRPWEGLQKDFAPWSGKQLWGEPCHLQLVWAQRQRWQGHSTSLLVTISRAIAPTDGVSSTTSAFVICWFVPFWIAIRMVTRKSDFFIIIIKAEAKECECQINPFMIYVALFTLSNADGFVPQLKNLLFWLAAAHLMENKSSMIAISMEKLHWPLTHNTMSESHWTTTEDRNARNELQQVISFLVSFHFNNRSSVEIWATHPHNTESPTTSSHQPLAAFTRSEVRRLLEARMWRWRWSHANSCVRHEAAVASGAEGGEKFQLKPIC